MSTPSSLLCRAAGTPEAHTENRKLNRGTVLTDDPDLHRKSMGEKLFLNTACVLNYGGAEVQVTTASRKTQQQIIKHDSKYGNNKS